MKAYKLLYIEWHDAYTYDSWDTEEGAIDMCKNMLPCHSVGWLLKETKDQITICHTFNPAMVMGSLHIPKGMIVRKMELKTGKIGLK